MVEHIKTCYICVPPGLPVENPSKCPNVPKQYDARLVLHTNLDAKLETLKETLGVMPSYYIYVKDGHPADKYKIFPGYKANRDRTQFDPRPLAEGYLRNSLVPGAKFAINSQYEADDTIASMAVEASRAAREVIVVSGDRDLWPLLQYPGVTIFSLAHKSFVGPELISKSFNGLKNPKFIPLHKALWGDASDNVPNAVPRMQKPLTPIIEASDGTLMDFLEKTDSFPISSRCLQLLQDNLRQVVINEKLVRLVLDVPVEFQ